VKKSTLKTILLISIIFLAIIAIIIAFYNNRIKALQEQTERMVIRIEAKTDIEPGTIITENEVRKVQVQDVLKIDDLLYKLQRNEPVDEEGNQLSEDQLKNWEDDGRWAIGKRANQKIYEGEFVSASKLLTEDEYYDFNERLYAVPFSSDTTGGYNISRGEYVDIVVRYKADMKSSNPTINAIYDSLEPNQLTDIVFAKRRIEDIRDETGVSVMQNSATKPGYLCFKLTYEEINKLEWARECGTIYIGKSEKYASEPYPETFMRGIELPSIGLQKDLPSQKNN